jgi:hypothetical protein
MNIDTTVIERIDGLYDSGRDLVERLQIHGAAVESQLDLCRFDGWRRKVNDLLFTVGGCEDAYYRRFSQEVTQPTMKSLQRGLSILSAVRDDLSTGRA